jgi:hypothetical protein
MKGKNMKKLIWALATSAICFAAAPAVSANIDVPAGWESAVAQAPAAQVQEQAPVEAAKSGATDLLAQLGEAKSVASAARWSDLDDSNRYLLIMGSVDGFASAGAGAPCFPGNDNASLDAKLAKAGFADKDPADLAAALTKLGTPADQCGGGQMRGYGNKLLKTMPDSHLSAYITGMVRAYAAVHPCSTAGQVSAGTDVAAAILAGDDFAQPAALTAPILAASCSKV